MNEKLKKVGRFAVLSFLIGVTLAVVLNFLVGLGSIYYYFIAANPSQTISPIEIHIFMTVTAFYFSPLAALFLLGTGIANLDD